MQVKRLTALLYLQLVWETGRTGTQLRMRVLRQQIRDASASQRNACTPCSEHYDTRARANCYVLPFYQLKTESTSTRLNKENYFIELFSFRLNNP